MQRNTTVQDQPTSTQNPPQDDEDQPKMDTMGVPATEKKPSLPKRLWVASGLNYMILMMMFKGAIAPTIAIAIYQASSIARIYSTLGYLVGIVSILSMPVLPRSKLVS